MSVLSNPTFPYNNNYFKQRSADLLTPMPLWRSVTGQSRRGAIRDNWENGIQCRVTAALVWLHINDLLPIVFLFFPQLSLQSKRDMLAPRSNSWKINSDPHPISKWLINNKSSQRTSERHHTFLHPKFSNSYASGHL